MARTVLTAAVIPITPMPRSYVPDARYAHAAGAECSVLGICGIVGALIAAAWNDRSTVGRAALRSVSIVLAATLPILLTILVRPYLYNGHLVILLFAVPRSPYWAVLRRLG